MVHERRVLTHEVLHEVEHEARSDGRGEEGQQHHTLRSWTSRGAASAGAVMPTRLTTAMAATATRAMRDELFMMAP